MSRYVKGQVPLPEVDPQSVHSADQVQVISPDGIVGTIAADELGQAVNEGYQQATPEALARNREAKEYGGGMLNTLEAGALGVLRGSSLGLSDVALRAVNPKWADAAEKLRRYNPDASLTGEIGSFFIPGIASAKVFGKAGQQVAKMGALQNLVSEGAGGLASVAKKIIGENLVGQAAGAAVKLGTEAAVFQAAHNLSEESLADHELTAESILAGTGKAAILGAGFGAALPLGFRATQKLAEAAAETAPVQMLAKATTRQLQKFFDPERSTQLFAGAAKKEFGPLGTKWRDDVAHLREEGAFKAGDVVLDRSTGTLKRTAEGMIPPDAETAIGRLQKIEQEAGSALGDAYDAAEAALAPGALPAGKGPDWVVDSLSKAKSIKRLKESLRQEISQIAPGTRKQLMQDINELAKNSPLVDPAPLRDIVSAYERTLAESGGSIQRIKEITTQLGEDIAQMKKGAFTGGIDVPPKIEVLMGIRQAMRDNLNYVVERLQQESAYRGPLMQIAPVAKLNKMFSSARNVLETMEARQAQLEGNVNVLGQRWRDMLTGAGGASIGGAMFGPVGAAVGSMAGFANKALQTNSGLLMRAEIGEKLRKLAWAESLMSKSQEDIARAIKGFVSGDAGRVGEEVAKRLGPEAYAMTSRATPTERTNSQQAWFDGVKKQIAAVTGDPASFAQHQGMQLQTFADAAPNVANLMINKQLQVYSYLQKVMPKNPGMPLSLFNDPWKPADYEIQDFRRVVQVARAPLTILSDVRAGTATPAQVQAIRELYPKIYETILTQVRGAVSDPKTNLSYPQRLKLAQLFPGTEPTMAPQFVQAMQTPMTKPDDPQAMPRAPQGGVKFSQRRLTASERAEMR